MRGHFGKHKKIGLCPSHALFLPVLFRERRQNILWIFSLSLTHTHHPHHNPFPRTIAFTISLSPNLLLLVLLPWLLLKQEWTKEEKKKKPLQMEWSLEHFKRLFLCRNLQAHLLITIQESLLLLLLLLLLVVLSPTTTSLLMITLFSLL